MKQVLKHSGIHSKGLLSVGYIDCPFCDEKNNLRSPSTTKQRCKGCGCMLHRTFAIFDIHKTPEYKNKRMKEFAELSEKQKANVCTAWSLSGDIKEILDLYKVGYYSGASALIVKWMKDPIINTIVKNNLLLIKLGVEQMKDIKKQ